MFFHIYLLFTFYRHEMTHQANHNQNLPLNLGLLGMTGWTAYLGAFSLASFDVCSLADWVTDDSKNSANKQD